MRPKTVPPALALMLLIGASGAFGAAAEPLRARVAAGVLPAAVEDGRLALPHPTLDTPLALLAAAARDGVAAAAAEARRPGTLLEGLAANGMLHLDGRQRVRLVAEGRSLAALTRAVAAAGGTVEHTDPAGNRLQALVPVESLEALAAARGVAALRLPQIGVVQAGSRTTQGDAALRAAELRAQLGVDGTGVTVGVISDGVAGLAAAQASGDLPAVDVATCNVNPHVDPGGAGKAEGTAMLEIVHDLAPGAALMFGNPGSRSELEFTAAVDCLAQHADVVVDDIVFLTPPYDGTSPVPANVTAELANPANRLRLYANAVGNSAEQHYKEMWRDSGQDFVANFAGTPFTYDLPRHEATAGTTDAGFAPPCFAGAGFACGLAYRVAAGGFVNLVLSWSDTAGAASDYDLFLLDPAGDVVAMSVNEQLGRPTDRPREFISFSNTGPEAVFRAVVARFHDPSSTRTVEVFAVGSLANFVTRAGSVPANSDARGVVSAGAIAASDPGLDTLESFSSHGPTADGRLKPDVTAVDGVSVTGSGGFAQAFFGTSAAGPHVAGIAALLLELHGELLHGEPGDDPLADRNRLRAGILAGAIDLGAPGPDNAFGFGRVDAVEASLSVPANAVSDCTPTATTACIDNAPGDKRFEVRVSYTSQSRGSGQAAAIPLATLGVGRGAAFTFFSSDNPEMLLKVLDGCSLNDRFWIFYAATTNVGFTVTVTDMLAGGVKTYTNALGTAAPPVQDTAALPCS